MTQIYDNWNEWYQAEKTLLNKNIVDYVIHPSGKDGADEWEMTGKRDSLYVIGQCNLKKEESVLEYGCGNGRILRHLKDYDSYGVDIVPQFVEEARGAGCRSYLLENFVRKVNNVYSLTVFIHLRKSQAETALKYIYEHLEEGGTAYIQALIYQKDKDAKNFSDMTSYKKESFVKIAEDAGFVIEALFENEGDIDKEEFGVNHNCFQILKKL
jgi:SAM-dependent methyltransferase